MFCNWIRIIKKHPHTASFTLIIFHAANTKEKDVKMAQQFDYNHLSALAEELSQQTKSLAATGSDQARALVRQKAEKLLKSLETPQESMLRMWLLEGTTKAVLQVGYDLDLFKFLSEAEGKPVTNAELADKTGADPKLLGKFTIVLSDIST